MNAAGFPILSLVTFLPLAGAFIIMMVRGEEEVVARNARWTALWTSLITFALSLVLWVRFDKSSAEFQFMERVDWLPDFGVSYHMGVDGISVLFVLLSTLLTPLALLPQGNCQWFCNSPIWLPLLLGPPTWCASSRGGSRP